MGFFLGGTKRCILRKKNYLSELLILQLREIERLKRKKERERKKKRKEKKEKEKKRERKEKRRERKEKRSK